MNRLSSRRLIRVLVLATAFFGKPLSALEVDVELALMVDVSRSMTPGELEIQRRGYAEALRSDEVIGAIETGLIGRIALTYVEWAGDKSQRVILPWQTIGSREDAEAVADRLTAEFSASMRRTSISGAIDHAVESMKTNGFNGLRRVIDVSGDGPNNAGRPVVEARDAALAEGIVINGLPLMTREGLGLRWHIDDLDQYYRDCVIGGPGAFVLPVLEWSEFALAVRRKLVMELVDAKPNLGGADSGAQTDNCLIGEKIWEDYGRRWNAP